MVLNDKILNRKYDAISRIMDQDGGCTLIEALGVLKWVEFGFLEAHKGGKLQPIKKDPGDYGKLKARRLSDIQGS